jgi:glycosyltransferase involved in cell wall biosynthesis
VEYPKISIITPTYNSSKYLEETIKSVLKQAYPNLEYIIIDGGSTDNTLEIINKYSDHISFWVSETDTGMYDALNKGFQKSTGEIMTWLNSDDLYHNGALLCVGEIFNNLEDVEWIIGKSCLFNANGLCVKMNDIQYWSATRLITGNYKWIQQENVFWRRTLWNNAGGIMNTSFRLASDFELWIRFFKNSSLHSVHTSFGGFRLHGQQLSITHSEQYEEEVLRILDANQRNNPRVVTGKILNYLINCIGESKNILLLMIKLVFELLSKRINKYSSSIYYDFSENRWKK